jgi:hypothetical protein
MERTTSIMKIFGRQTISMIFWICFTTISGFAQSSFRIFPYLQVNQQKVQIRWFASENLPSTLEIKDHSGAVVFSGSIPAVEVPEFYYTQAEKNQSISGLENQSWIGAEKYFKYEKAISLQGGKSYQYTVNLNGQNFSSSFKTAPSLSDWESVRFIALSDSETEPRGRVTNRAWYPGNPLNRLFPVPSAWKVAFGTTVEEGFELPNYMLSEEKGFAENLKILKSRNPDFVLMPGDLVQGGAYMPGWDEFWRHTSGPLDQIFDRIPIVPALGNWEAFGGVNGSYGFNERGMFNPVLGRLRFHRFFEFPTEDQDQNHRQSYYRTDYGPVTILTLDSSNGTPDQKRSDFSDSQKVKNKEMTEIGTDTQENYTQSEYNAAGGSDLSGFGPGSAQYQWLEKNLELAQSQGRLIFVQFHHIPYSSGEHGVPINHELATGQGGVPMRILNPLFEKFGVIAVFAGHDELFERSFVDEDGDGKGVHYYDVGVAGDGMRGVKRNWLSSPLQTLDYNSFSQWTADQKSLEVWDNSGSNPVLLDGGKHYGHLEVNVKKVKDGSKTFAQIDFEPVYAFPVMNSQYQLQRVERRVYNDPVRIMVELAEGVVAPVFKNELTVELDQTGKFLTKLQDYLQNEVQQDWKVDYSRSNEYTCADLDGTENELKVTDSKGNSWNKVVIVRVLDKSPPVFEPKEVVLTFDKVIGKLELTPQTFSVSQESILDNCQGFGAFTIELDKKVLTCSDLTNQPIEVKISVTDRSGNVSTKSSKVTLNPMESKTISIYPSESFQGRVGESLEIKLGEEFPYTVDSWIRDGQPIANQKGKSILVSQSGTYWAKVVPNGGCVVETKKVAVTFSEKPYSPLKPSIEVSLNTIGKATIQPQDLFSSWPPANPNLDIKLSQSEFTCSDLGEKQVVVTIKNQSGQTWEEKTLVKIQDKTAPLLTPKNLEVNYDITQGSISLKPEDFLTAVSDNCSVKELTISKTSISCEDLGKEFSIAIRAVDASGNVSEATSKLTVNRVENQKVTISGKDQICQGQKGILTLTSSQAFEVIRWRRNGVEVSGQTGKTLEVSEPGKYHAVIRYPGACLSETVEFEVKVNPLPSGQIEVDGNILRAPAGDFTYQWFRNGEKINGATNRVLTVDLMGEYAVEMTSQAGCTSKLAPVTLTISGLGSSWVKKPIELKIFPNPASSKVYIQLPGDAEIDVSAIQIYNMEGKKVSELVSKVKVSESQAELSISSLASGAYLVWIIGDSQNSYLGKFVIVK